MAEWQPIETAPENGPFIGGYFNSSGEWVQRFVHAINGWVGVGDFYVTRDSRSTHWQPAPEPPPSPEHTGAKP